MFFNPQVVVREGAKCHLKMDYAIYGFPYWKDFQMMEKVLTGKV